jgi:hypothetical protein
LWKIFYDSTRVGASTWVDDEIHSPSFREAARRSFCRSRLRRQPHLHLRPAPKHPRQDEVDARQHVHEFVAIGDHVCGVPAVASAAKDAIVIILASSPLSLQAARAFSAGGSRSIKNSSTKRLQMY